MVHEVGRSIAHRARTAEWAHAAALAGKGNDVVVAAMAAMHADETLLGDAAIEVAAEGLFDEARQSAVLPRLAKEVVQMLLHHAVERAMLGPVPLA